MVMISLREGAASGTNENNRSRSRRTCSRYDTRLGNRFMLTMVAQTRTNEIPPIVHKAVVANEFTLIHPVSIKERGAREASRFEMVTRVYQAAARSQVFSERF